MTKSLPYWLIIRLFSVLGVLFKLTVASLVAYITGQTFQRTRATKFVRWPMHEM